MRSEGQRGGGGVGVVVLYRVREQEALMVQNILKFMTECQATTATSADPS